MDVDPLAQKLMDADPWAQQVFPVLSEIKASALLGFFAVPAAPVAKESTKEEEEARAAGSTSNIEQFPTLFGGNLTSSRFFGISAILQFLERVGHFSYRFSVGNVTNSLEGVAPVAK